MPVPLGRVSGRRARDQEFAAQETRPPPATV